MNYCNSDWSSNEPNTLPIKLISYQYISGSSIVNLHVHKDNKNATIPISLYTLWEQLSKEYPVHENSNGSKYIDIRFIDEPYYVEDKNSSYKDYNVELDEHISKINYISCNKSDTKLVLTTDSFEYDYYKEKDTHNILHSVNTKYKEYNYDPDTEMATMGCVDGCEQIRVRIDEEEIYNSFENIWYKLINSNKFKVNKYSENTLWIDTNGKVEIYDSFVCGFVNVKKFIRNNDMGRWNKIWFKTPGGQNAIFATDDHPFPTPNGRVQVKDLKVGDELYRTMTHNTETYKITNIIKIGNRNSYEYDVETDTDHFDVSGVNSHNCRTLIGYDRFGAGYSKQGRGNISPATMNIAQLGIDYGICLGEREEPDLEGFNKALDKLLQITEKSLLDRYKYIVSQRPTAAYFMYDNETILDADKAREESKVEPALRHGTLAFGFIGVSNALYALFGKYQDDPEVRKFGNSIVKKIYDYAKDASERNNLNFSTYATPAEGSCYTIMKKMQERYGKIKGVTDKEYLNNSYHVPVYLKMSVKDKIDIESEYTWMCTGGK